MQHSVSTLRPGAGFTRYAIAKALTRGNPAAARDLARERWRSSPDVAAVLDAEAQGFDFGQEMMQKTAVAAGSVGDGSWAGPLAYAQALSSEFVALLRPMTIAGRLAGKREVPLNVRVVVQTAGAAVGWIGEAGAAPVSPLAFTQTTLGIAKAAGIVVVTEELARLADPAAEALVRSDLLATAAAFLDQQLIDPAVAAVAGTSPAAITHGISATVSSGSTAVDLAADFGAMLATLADADYLAAPYWIMRNSDAAKLAAKLTASGGAAFPNITVKGGTLLGIPVVTSNHVPASVSGGSIIVLADAAELLYGDAGVTVEASGQASLLMDSAPGAGAQNMVSMFQTGSIALRVTAFVNWQMRRSGAIAVLDQVHL